MGAQRRDAAVMPADLDALRAELAAWRRAEGRDGPGDSKARPTNGIDLDLAPLRDTRPLRAAPATADEYVAALRSELIDLRVTEPVTARA